MSFQTAILQRMDQDEISQSAKRALRKKQLSTFAAWPASPKREIGICQRGFSFQTEFTDEERAKWEKMQQKESSSSQPCPTRRLHSDSPANMAGIPDSPPIFYPSPPKRVLQADSPQPNPRQTKKSGEKRVTIMSATSTEMTIETTPLQKFQCVQKVQDIPTINSASLLLFDLYGKAKGMHPLLSKTLGYCETTSENMITPLMTSFEKPLQTVDSVASQGIEYITNKYPIVKKEPQEILQTTVKPAVDKIQGVKEYGQVKIQTVMKKGQEQADIILDNKPARMALTGLQTGLMGANDFLNQYYPLESDKEEDTDEKVTVKATVEKPKNPTGQAVLVFSLLLQLNAHIYGVMKQQMTRIHELTMSKLNQLTGVITMMETAKAEGKAGEGLVGKAKELSGSLLHFYTETAHSLVSKFPSLVTTYFDFVRCEMQQLFDVFAKAETISDIPSNMLTFTKKSVETTQSTMVKMYKLIKGPEGEAVEKKDQ